MFLVKEATAASGSTVTVQLVAGVLDGKLVVVGELLPPVDLAQSEDHNVLLALHVDDTRVAVGLTGVVDEACCIPMHGGVYHIKVVDAEHIAANALQKMQRQQNYLRNGWLGKW